MSRPALLVLFCAIGMALLNLWLCIQPQAVSGSEEEPAESTGPSIPPVRVLLRSNDGASSIRVTGPYRVVPPEDWRILAQGESLDTSEVTATEDGIQIGGRSFPLRKILVEPIESGSLWHNTRRYRGKLLLIRRDGKRVDAINVVRLEDYLASVINGEMPDTFPLAAREAQIIAARTYTLYQMKTFGPGRDYDVFSSARSQMYRGVEYLDQQGQAMLAETAGSRKLAGDTQGVVLLYQDRIFCAYYSAVCGGHSLDGRTVFRDATPPLLGVLCEDCSDAMNYRWEKTVDRDEFQENLADYLRAQGEDLGRLKLVEVDEATPGTMSSVTITGEQGSLDISTETLRRAVLADKSLPSAMFSLEVETDSIRIHGRGWGHGVGLCQWGARHQAELGHSVAEILRHYYPNTTLGWIR